MINTTVSDGKCNQARFILMICLAAIYIFAVYVSQLNSPALFVKWREERAAEGMAYRHTRCFSSGRLLQQHWIL